jgi:hypothetical protein
MKKLLLSLLLVLSFSSSAISDELIGRGVNYDLYKVDDQTRRIEIDGPISNAEPFDHDGPMVPQTYDWSDVQHLGGNIYRLNKGQWGYTANIGDTTQGGLAGGEVRVHPVRKRWDVYYSVAPLNPVALSHRQVSDKLLELYVDTAQVRYSFFIGDRGFKINNLLKANYTGGDTFAYTYDVAMQGLTRQGRTVLFNGIAVGNLPDPYMTDGNGETYPVQETLSGGQATLTATGINSLVLPVTIDPSFGPANPSQDAHLVSWNPNAGFGQSPNLNLLESLTRTIRQVSQVDVSSVSGTVTAATYEIKTKSVSAGDPVGRAIEIARLNTLGWEDDGTTTVGAECNWNNYKDPAVAWPVGAGAADVDETYLVNTTIASIGSWTTFSIVDLVQDAVDNHSGLLNTRVKYEQEGVTSGTNGDSVVFDSLESATAADRPKYTITYTIPSTTVNTHLGYKQMVFDR